MELTEMVRHYTKKRDDFVTRIATVSRRLDEWTDEHEKVSPRLTDIARFEAMRAERSRLLAEFTEAEDAFVVQMLQQVGASYRPEA